MKLGAKEYAVIADAVMGLIMLLVANFAPAQSDLVKQVLLILQPVIGIFIGAVSYENAVKAKLSLK